MTEDIVRRRQDIEKRLREQEEKTRVIKDELTTLQRECPHKNVHVRSSTDPDEGLGLHWLCLDCHFSQEGRVIRRITSA